MRCRAFVIGGTVADAVAGCAQHPLEVFGVALGASHLHRLVAFHHQKFKACIAL